MFDSCLNKYLNFRFSKKHGSQKKDSAHYIKLFYKSQMHANYKIKENIIRKTIRDKVKLIERNSNLKFYICYNNLTTHNLIVKNSPANCTNKAMLFINLRAHTITIHRTVTLDTQEQRWQEG